MLESGLIWRLKRRKVLYKLFLKNHQTLEPDKLMFQLFSCSKCKTQSLKISNCYLAKIATLLISQICIFDQKTLCWSNSFFILEFFCLGKAWIIFWALTKEISVDIIETQGWLMVAFKLLSKSILDVELSIFPIEASRRGFNSIFVSIHSQIVNEYRDAS